MEDTLLKYHDIIEVSVFAAHNLDNKPAKTLTVIAFEGEDHKEKAEKKLQDLYGWKSGFHYSRLTTKVVGSEGTKLINNQKDQEEMAKTTKAKAAEETGVALFEEQSKSLTLPVVPAVMNIGGVTFSEELIQKEVDAIKKVSIEVPLDTDTKDILDNKKKAYEEMKANKNKFVKTRTAPEKFRQEVSKPINAWTKELKSQTDKYGAIAQIGEDYCAAEMKKYEDWEAEQANKERIAAEKRLKERSQQLSDLQGVQNFESGHWNFPWAPHIIIEKATLEAEFGWDDEYKVVKDEFDAYEAEKQAEETKNQALAQSLFNSRVMLLEMMEYTESSGNYMKNGHVITPNHISSKTDAEWKALLESQKTPVTVESALSKTATTNPFQTPVASIQPSPAATDSKNPFAQFAIKEEPAPSTEQLSEFERLSNVTDNMVITSWDDDNQFVEYTLPATVLRVYPTYYAESASKVDGQIGFQGEMGLGLNFIIYKKNDN